MIGKISIAKSFRACINYCLNDKVIAASSQEVAFKNRAEIIDFNKCFGSKNELIEQFNDVGALNQKVQKPVLHIMLSLAAGEQLDKGQQREMVGECAKEMGFRDNQYVAISHIDTNHFHLHIVANRVGYDGRVVSDSHNYKKIAQYCRKMELKYHLKQVLNPKKYLPHQQRNIPRLDTRKEKLKADIKSSLSTSRDYCEFENKIGQLGYDIIKGRGISFIDKQAVKIKGSEVGFSLQRIEKILALQQQLGKIKEARTKHQESYKQIAGNNAFQESHSFNRKENLLTKTIDILISRPPYEDQPPMELLQENKQQMKKKKRQHLSQHH